jgi:5'(3')-deoxyribonucleotidase
MKQQLFLDCDGVLADFDKAAEKIFGMPPREAEEQIGTPQFWAKIRHQRAFYRHLELMPDARELFNAVAHLSPVILTGCPLGGWAEAQKEEWAAEHFPGTKIITCLSAEKRMHMRHGDVLVDDYLKYRSRWEDEGGIFIHHTSAQSTLAALEQIGMLSPQSSH